MAEVDFERKRRLPLWMRGVTVADELRKSANRDQIHMSEDEHSLSQSSCETNTEPAKRPEKRIPNNKVKGTSETFSSSLVQCETTKITRKSYRQDLGPSGSITVTNKSDLSMEKSNKRHCVERGVEEQAALNPQELKGCVTESGHELEATSLSRGCGGGKRSAKKRAPKKQKLKPCVPEGIDDIVCPSEGAEDVVLTMEDLMNMAEEHVQANRDKECEQAAHRESKSKCQLPCMSIFSGNESVGSLQATGNIQEMQVYARERPGPDLVKSRGKEKDFPAKEDIVNISKKGDPAQDMLDLLLGPLLKKPQAVEKKFELMEDVTFSQYYCNSIQSQVPVVVPLTKKKSSLKEKVAMFLTDHDV